MLVITYSGYLNVFTINSNKTINKIYTLSLLNVLPYGVYCAEIDLNSEYLLIGSFTSNSNGIYVWKILNQEPWIKHFPIINNTDSYKVNIVIYIFY